jgi:cytochrome b6-f complex iron-sulfur subunit
MVPPMHPEATPDRRSVVTAAVLGAGGLAALTACAPGSTGPDGVVAGSASSASRAAAGLVKLSEVPVGGSIAARTTGGAVVVAQPTAGRVVAFSAICTHQGCRVNPQGPQLHCPCHGSVFDAFTGTVLRGPAHAPLQSVPVKVAGQDVVAG